MKISSFRHVENETFVIYMYCVPGKITKCAKVGLLPQWFSTITIALALKCFEQDQRQASFSIKDCFLYSQVCFTKRIIGRLGDDEKSFRGCESLTKLGMTRVV